MTRQIPNFFTLLNLVFGCLAIVAILQNGIVIRYDAQLIDIPEKIWMASAFIGLAALVDFLDGFVARIFKATSAIGKQLDSLADIVSFGVAPSLIIYQFLRLSLASDTDGINASVFWLAPAFLIACASAWRLATFNLDESQALGFKGMPTPVTGLFVASLPLIYWNDENERLTNLILNKWFLYGIILLLSWLMVSRIPMMALKFKDRSIQKNIPKIILLIGAIIAAILFQWLAIPMVFVLYIILSLSFKQP